jgi:hypothetical protein
VIAVAVTSLRCWLAQEYAQIPGEQAQGSPAEQGIHLGVLAAPWPMVTASYLPLLALVLARLAGTSALTAATSA